MREPMPKQTTRREIFRNAHPPRERAAGLPSAPPRSAPSQESLHRAMRCIESAGRRLKSGEVDQADEALVLLRAAAAHLEQALQPVPGPLYLAGAE